MPVTAKLVAPSWPLSTMRTWVAVRGTGCAISQSCCIVHTGFWSLRPVQLRANSTRPSPCTSSTAAWPSAVVVGSPRTPLLCSIPTATVRHVCREAPGSANSKADPTFRCLAFPTVDHNRFVGQPRTCVKCHSAFGGRLGRKHPRSSASKAVRQSRSHVNAVRGVRGCAIALECALGGEIADNWLLGLVS